MINLLLKAKHWHLFSMVFIIPMILYFVFMGVFISSVVGNDNPDPSKILSLFSVFLVIVLLAGSVQFAWFWAVGVGINKNIADDIKLNVRRFRTAFIFVVIISLGYIYMMFVFMNNISFIAQQQNFNPALPGLLIPLVLLLIFSVFYIYYFVAKTIRTAELQRKLEIGDYIGEFFLIYFFPIGIWFLQPKVNEIHSTHSELDNRKDVL